MFLLTDIYLILSLIIFILPTNQQFLNHHKRTILYPINSTFRKYFTCVRLRKSFFSIDKNNNPLDS